MILNPERQDAGWLFRCDECGIEFFSKQKKKLLKEHHFHNRECTNKSLKDGILRKITDETCIKKYGVKTPSKSSEVKKRTQETCLKKYGTNAASSSAEVRKKLSEKNKLTYLEKKEELQEKRKQTNLFRLGVEYPMMSQTVKEKSKKTCQEKYGVENISQNAEIIDKRLNTFEKKYGFRSPMKVPEIVAGLDWNSIVKKRYSTMKENNSFLKSEPEEKLYEYLCKRYGIENVERQKIIHRWPIDFFVSCKDKSFYVQLDGVYWHGLDRPIEIISEYKNKQDKVIHKKWLTDREQDEWFLKNNLVLIRITDKQLKSGDFNI